LRNAQVKEVHAIKYFWVFAARQWYTMYIADLRLMA